MRQLDYLVHNIDNCAMILTTETGLISMQWRLIGSNDFINDLCLQNIPLLDRLFTWSNNQDSPTLCRLDRALVNLNWSSFFPDTIISSSTRVTSYHVSIVLQAATSVPKPSVFRFNNHWLGSSSFPPIASQNWESLLQHDNNAVASICLHLKGVRDAAKKWDKNRKNPSVLVTNCGIVIDFFDKVEELWPLGNLGRRLRFFGQKIS